ncbi:MAG: hypothetical protein ACJ8EY_02340 [Sphingomicrobium sp.]
MNLRSKIALTLVACTLPAGALASSCKVQNASAPGHWKFIRAFDPVNQEQVLGQAIDGGDTKSLTVKGKTVRVDSKLAGHVNYSRARVLTCKGGNIIRL